MPAWQVSLCVQALPSSHGVPSTLFAGLEHIPVAGSQTPAVWHGSGKAQVTGMAPAQTPVWQVSLCVQLSPSSHAAPFALAGLEHIPVAGSHTPAVWH
jgi:hypothetical protein